MGGCISLETKKIKYVESDNDIKSCEELPPYYKYDEKTGKVKNKFTNASGVTFKSFKKSKKSNCFSHTPYRKWCE
jgi:hypothetical protein